MRTTIPLAERRGDGVFIAFWMLNLTFVTYAVDLEQLVIANPADFDYPVWPPAPLVDLVHWWGARFDPALYARPPWWRATIWIDVLLFGPFYAAAIFAYWKGREWIRNPSLIWCGLMFASVTIILFEELQGSHATPVRSVVLLANVPWLLMPIATAVRMWPRHPFSRTARDSMADYRIQPADTEMLGLLPAIEMAAAEVFPAEDLAPELREEGLPLACFEQAAREGRVWTAVARTSGRPVGFALATIVDGSAHLHEMDVHPDHGRRGLGAALVDAVVTWARGKRFACVTLTTFRHLPWNAPFYRRLGFEEIAPAEVTPGLAQLLEQEVRHGLDGSKRVAMRLDLRTP